MQTDPSLLLELIKQKRKVRTTNSSTLLEIRGFGDENRKQKVLQKITTPTIRGKGENEG